MFLGYANQWVLTPIIPLYVQDLGGSTFLAGLVLLAFAIPSFTIRPFVGHVADRWSAAGVLAIGLALLASGTLLCLFASIAMLFVGNVIRGIAWAGVNTGGYTTLATAAPPERRGEAAGYYTSVTTSAQIAFPALGLWLIGAVPGFKTVFVVSALLAIAGLPFALKLTRNKAQAGKTAPPASDGSSRLIEPGVLLATALNLCSTLVSPAVMAFLPLYARSLDIPNIGAFYVLAGATSIIIRPILGKKSDAIGRAPAIAFGLTSQLIGLALIVAARDISLILAGGFFFAVGMSMMGSTTTALAMDLANPHARGRAMATFSISFQIGAGTGAIVSGALADAFGLRAMYVGAIVITLAGFALLATAWKSVPKPEKG